MTRILCTAVGLGLILAVNLPGTTILGSSPAFLGYAADNAIDTGVGQFATDFASAGAGTGTFINFDLGSGFGELANIQYTNRTTSSGVNGGLTFGLSDFVTQYEYFYFTDSTFTTSFGNSGVIDFAVPVVADVAHFQQLFALAIPGPVQFLRFQVLAVNGNGANPGAADFQFNAVATATPEPSGIVLMGIGLALLTSVNRYRKPSSSATA